VTAVEEIEARVGVLEGLALFTKTERPALEHLAGLVQPVDVPAQIDVVTEGGVPDALWILVEGTVRVSAADADIRTISAPAYFGEVGTLTEIRRIATVTTTEPCKLWRIPSRDFLEAIGPSR
jgi:CRP-like cAMP-binding protein